MGAKGIIRPAYVQKDWEPAPKKDEGRRSKEGMFTGETLRRRGFEDEGVYCAWLGPSR